MLIVLAGTVRAPTTPSIIESSSPSTLSPDKPGGEVVREVSTASHVPPDAAFSFACAIRAGFWEGGEVPHCPVWPRCTSQAVAMSIRRSMAGTSSIVPGRSVMSWGIVL
jgi:hypothetical protein